MGLSDQAPNPRALATQALQRILDSGQALDEALEVLSRGLKPEDRGLLRAIVMASLRHKGSIEFLLTRYLSRALPKSGRLAHLALLSGAAQLLFIGVPAHAAVNEQVSLLPEDSKFRGVVNAVLRRIDGNGRTRIEDPKVLQRDLPGWLWHRWKADWGAEPAMKMIQAQGQDIVPLDITVKSDAPGWAERLGGEAVGHATVRLARSGAVGDLPGYQDGQWWIQDLAATIPAHLLGPIDGKRVLDACAAPGGKTAQLASAGAKVIALDRSAKRLKRLSENMARLDLQAETVVADLRQYAPAEPFDAILLDAPCSATGTLRRHPDIGWNRTDEDVATLAALQSDLLDRAAGMIIPGGRLVYCTCSLEKAEGEEQVERFLARNDGFRRAPIRADETGLRQESVDGKGQLRTLPSHLTEKGGMDGFFAARLVRK